MVLERCTANLENPRGATSFPQDTDEAWVSLTLPSRHCHRRSTSRAMMWRLAAIVDRLLSVPRDPWHRGIRKNSAQMQEDARRCSSAADSPCTTRMICRQVCRHGQQAEPQARHHQRVLRASPSYICALILALRCDRPMAADGLKTCGAGSDLTRHDDRGTLVWLRPSGAHPPKCPQFLRPSTPPGAAMPGMSGAYAFRNLCNDRRLSGRGLSGHVCGQFDQETSPT